MKIKKSSRLKGFYHLSISNRLSEVARWADLIKKEEEILYSHKGFHTAQCDKMIENVMGIFPMPMGIAPNFKVNGKDYLVPMCIEEASVVAAASNSARYLRYDDGIESIYDSSIMIGQIQLKDIEDLDASREKIFAHKEKIIDIANKADSVMVRLGGGLKKIEVRDFPSTWEEEAFSVVHLHVDVRDAMGANAVNTICENVGPFLAKITGARVGLKILSNLADNRLIKVTGRVPLGALSKDPSEAIKIAQVIEEASRFAERDPYRAVTHNKGIMNGIDSVLLATGQDWRAVEAGAHAYASRSGKYTALSTWRLRKKSRILEGRLEMPLAIGIVGGITQVHPTVKICLKILGVDSAGELAQVVGSVGLAQNLAALMALSTEGIQRGHMSLHSRNIAASIGAKGEEIELVAEVLIEEGAIIAHRAQEILWDIRKEKSRELAITVGASDIEVEDVSEALLIEGVFKVRKAREVLGDLRRSRNGTSHGARK